jgi:hypothetical protein
MRVSFCFGSPGRSVKRLSSSDSSDASLQNDPGGSRTRDLRIKSPLLYQLSYRVKHFHCLVVGGRECHRVPRRAPVRNITVTGHQPARWLGLETSQPLASAQNLSGVRCCHATATVLACRSRTC